MKRKVQLATGLAFAMTAMFSLQASAQEIKFKGVYEDCRWTNEESAAYKDAHKSIGSMKYIDENGNPIEAEGNGWHVDANGYIANDNGYIMYASYQDGGIYSMTWNGSTLTQPANDPALPTDFYKTKDGEFYKIVTDIDKFVWLSNLNMMSGKSGGVYADGKLYLVNSRDESSTVDDELFRVTSWDAETGDLISNKIFPKSACIESAGMAYNPKDGVVYGLFLLTEQDLPDEIKNDPNFFVDEDGDSSAEDAGYAICAIDLNTMKIKPITPGLYYGNFITFAINEEGRAFALTSGGTSSTVTDADGHLVDINGKVTGAQLIEFDLSTGLQILKSVEATDPETGETYIEKEPVLSATGFASQFRRQSACFAKSNPNKMYWNGFVNSGKGINSWGSWGSLPDKEWRTNEKYDMALYEVDVTTGLATRLSKVPERYRFSVLWVDKDNSSDERPVNPPSDEDPQEPIVNGIQTLNAQAEGFVQVYNTSGQQVFNGKSANMSLKPGMYIIKDGSYTQKVLVK